MKSPVLIAGLAMLGGCAAQGVVCETQLEPINRPISLGSLPVSAPGSRPTPIPAVNVPGTPEPASPIDAASTSP